MKIKSIIWKLFFLLVGLFTSFFILMYLGQTFFLEQYYIDKKEEVVAEPLQKFVDNYKLYNWDPIQVQEKTNEFYNQTNAFVAVVDSKGFIKNETEFSMTITLSKGKHIKISLNNALFGNDAEKLFKLNLTKGEQVHVEGFYYDDIIHPLIIQTSKGKWISDFENVSGFSTNTISFNGVIDGAILPSETDMAYSSKMDMFIRAVQSWFIEVKQGKINIESGVYDYTDYVNGIKNKVFVEPLINNNGNQEFIFALTSLQPVSEAMIVFKDFYLYAFLIIIIIIVLFSFYLSKYIANPLLEINDLTKRMAKLDFSKRISYNRQDEIGELSQSINEMSENLKSTVHDLQVANEQLLLDIEKERKLEVTRKEFISGVSHELKTPLSIVKSYAEGIKDGIAKNRSDAYIEVIIDEVDKMENLIGDMLDLARLESDGVKLDIKPFQLKAKITEILERMDFMFQAKNLHVDIHLKDSIVIGDESRIEQVLINFIRNAIQYTPNGNKIEIEMFVKDNEVITAIRNYGVVIPADQMEQMWDRFYRVDRSRHRENGGTGLGLAITKTILSLHHSTYSAKSLKDGVEFSFTLPQK
ncbi:MAG: ATP-binding protein [Bacillaceae bacterium]